MKIIAQLIILTLSFLLVMINADQYCDNLFEQHKQFKRECSPARISVNSCCDLTGFPLSKAPSAVYQMNCKCGGGHFLLLLMFIATCPLIVEGGLLYRETRRIV